MAILKFENGGLQQSAAVKLKRYTESERGGLPPKRDVNLFILRVGGRGAGVIGRSGADPGLRVCLFVCLCVCLSQLVWWVVGERISGQGPDQTIQNVEIYKK